MSDPLKRASEIIAERDGQLEQLRADVQILTKSRDHCRDEMYELEDCRQALRDLGLYCGCDHVESADERRVQVRHIREAFERQREEIERVRDERTESLSLCLAAEEWAAGRITDQHLREQVTVYQQGIPNA